LYWQKPIVVKCADKYELREYVGSLGLMELMPQLYGTFNYYRLLPIQGKPAYFFIKTLRVY